MIMVFLSKAFLYQFFACFIVFSYTRLNVFTQALNLENFIFDFKGYSLVKKIAIDVIKLKLLALGIARIELTKDIVIRLIVKLYPNRKSERNKITSFYINI